MKKLYKYLSVTALSGILCFSLSLTANAQHHPTNGGGGGGGNSNPPPAQSSPPPQRTSVAPTQSRSAAPQSYSRPAAPRSSNSVRTYSTPRTNGVVQRSGVTQRTYVNGSHNGYIGRPNTTGATAQRYRSYQGSVYGKNHPGSPYAGRGGYLPGRTSYHYNHGYYGSYYAPRLGFSIGFLPYGYYPFYFDDYQYFYSGGLFYQYNNDQYTVVEPPVGAEITTLPSNAQSIVINGQQYYEVNGVYYEPITKDDGTLSYQVAGKDGELNTADDQGVDNAPPAPQIGDIVTQLPPNCRKVSINGEKLYLSEDGIYYKAQLDQDNNKVYKIVGLPADEDQGQPGDQGGN